MIPEHLKDSVEFTRGRKPISQIEIVRLRSRRPNRTLSIAPKTECWLDRGPIQRKRIKRKGIQ